jgi:DNA-binding transcriptional LysR family regulator
MHHIKGNHRLPTSDWLPSRLVVAIMYEGPEFRHLVSFVAVAEEFSFSRAAKRLHIAQPSLSAQMKLIEEGIGAILLIRGQSGVSLTASGRQFLVFARLMLHMRGHSVRATTSDKTGTEWPLRFGYSPFADHRIVEEALNRYLELVPGGHIQTSSECSAELTTMVADGRLDAAIVTLPLAEKGLFVHPLCEERLLVCLRRDDPLAAAPKLSHEAIEARLCILFGRDHQPLLYDQILRRLAQAGIPLSPSEFVSAPAEMQYLVKRGRDFSLAQESTHLDSELTMRGIVGVNLTVTTALICNAVQIRPVLPMLAFRIEKHLAMATKMDGRKRPNERATTAHPIKLKKAS